MPDAAVVTCFNCAFAGAYDDRSDAVLDAALLKWDFLVRCHIVLDESEIGVVLREAVVADSDRHTYSTDGTGLTSTKQTLE